MKQFRFKFTNILKMVVDPFLNALYRLTDKYRQSHRDKTLYLSGDVEAEIPLLRDDLGNEITATVKVLDHTHRHAQSQLSTSVTATPNSLACRDSTGGIVSRSNTLDTGYILADGKDIGTIFAAKNDPLFTCDTETIHTNSPTILGKSIVVQDAILKNEGNKLVLEIHTIRFCK